MWLMSTLARILDSLETLDWEKKIPHLSFWSIVDLSSCSQDFKTHISGYLSVSPSLLFEGSKAPSPIFAQRWAIMIEWRNKYTRVWVGSGCTARGAHKCEKCHLPFRQDSHFSVSSSWSPGDCYVLPSLRNLFSFYWSNCTTSSM